MAGRYRANYYKVDKGYRNPFTFDEETEIWKKFWMPRGHPTNLEEALKSAGKKGKSDELDSDAEKAVKSFIVGQELGKNSYILVKKPIGGEKVTFDKYNDYNEIKNVFNIDPKIHDLAQNVFEDLKLENLVDNRLAMVRLQQKAQREGVIHDEATNTFLLYTKSGKARKMILTSVMPNWQPEELPSSEDLYSRLGTGASTKSQPSVISSTVGSPGKGKGRELPKQIEEGEKTVEKKEERPLLTGEYIRSIKDYKEIGGDITNEGIVDALAYAISTSKNKNPNYERGTRYNMKKRRSENVVKYKRKELRKKSELLAHLIHVGGSFGESEKLYNNYLESQKEQNKTMGTLEGVKEKLEKEEEKEKEKFKEEEEIQDYTIEQLEEAYGNLIEKELSGDQEAKEAAEDLAEDMINRMGIESYKIKEIYDGAVKNYNIDKQLEALKKNKERLIDLYLNRIRGVRLSEREQSLLNFVDENIHDDDEINELHNEIKEESKKRNKEINDEYERKSFAEKQKSFESEYGKVARDFKEAVKKAILSLMDDGLFKKAVELNDKKKQLATHYDGGIFAKDIHDKDLEHEKSIEMFIEGDHMKNIPSFQKYVDIAARRKYTNSLLNKMGIKIPTKEEIDYAQKWEDNFSTITSKEFVGILGSRLIGIRNKAVEDRKNEITKDAKEAKKEKKEKKTSK